MDRAVVPGSPFTPDIRRNFMLGSLAGLLLALGLVLAIDYLDDTVKTPEDITRRLKLPFLGLVPAVKGNNHPLLSQEVPHEFGEAFRALRTSLVFSSGSEGTRVIGAHQRPAARRQDDDGLQHGDRAGLRRLARAAHRRRHAAPERVAHARHREHDWPVAPADRSGDRAAGHPAARTCRICG